MSESETQQPDESPDADADAADDEHDSPAAEGEQATRRTGNTESCRRCGREQGLVGKYDIYLCRQCFREVARGMGFKKYR